jgi:hypothetical protein
MREELKRGIDGSKVFVVLGTREYFEDASLFEQIAYAKKLKKPFAILLEKNANMPDNFLDEVEVYKIFPFDRDDNDGLNNQLTELVEWSKGF